jgi:hypothetical protein
MRVRYRRRQQADTANSPRRAVSGSLSGTLKASGRIALTFLRVALAAGPERVG